MRVSIVMAEAGSAAAAAPLARDPRLDCRFWLSEAAQRHVSLPSRPLEQSSDSLSDADVLLLSMTGNAVEPGLVEAARARNLPSVQVLDVWGPFTHRVTGALADRVAVIDDAARQDAMVCGVEEDRLVITGQAAWEQAVDLPPAPARKAAFISQPISRLYGDRLGYDETSALGVLEAAAAVRPDLIEEIVVVPHPAGDLLAHDPRVATLANALAGAGTVVSAFSSAMVDAFIGGRRVISLQPCHAGEDRCALSRYRLVPCARDVNSLLLALPEPNSGADHLRRTLSGSSRRLADLLLDLAR